MNAETLEGCARNLLTCVIADGRWLPALEGMMAHVGALGGGIARIAPPAMDAVPTAGVAPLFRDIKAGRAPVLTPRTSLRPGAGDGFVADHIAIPEGVRVKDTFYQEFLRPRGCVHKAAALLDADGGGAVDTIFYRTAQQGPFQRDELCALGTMLPYMRAAAMVARGALTGAARRQAEVFDSRGEPVVHLTADGRVAAMNAAAEAGLNTLFAVSERRVATTLPSERSRLDRAVSRALLDGRPGLVTVTTNRGDGRAMALVVPVLGHAHDLFGTVAALVVFLEADRPASTGAIQVLRESACLTGREVDVVERVAAGRTPREAAEDLGIALGTARIHLKSAYSRLGVHSQAGLVALLGRLQ